jgi:uncharacterized membrane protein YfcA
MGTEIIIFVIIMAFFCEYIDSSLGMGYGTVLTPALLLAGFKPLEIVPCILFSELCTGLLGAILHHKEGNIRLKGPGSLFGEIISKIKKHGLINGIKEGATFHLKIVLSLVSASIFGAIIAVFIANLFPKELIQLYIGFIVISMGVLILVSLGYTFKFSWLRISVLGLLASFNKGLTGGGYGPLIASGQIISGVASKSVAGTTGLAESLTCFIGLALYFFTAKSAIRWDLAPYITIGAIAAVPFAVKSVKRIKERKLKMLVGLLSIILGAFTLAKTIKLI